MTIKMITKRRSNVTYDYDMYKNKIRKYVKVGTYRDGKDRRDIWKEDEHFVPEKGVCKTRLQRSNLDME